MKTKERVAGVVILVVVTLTAGFLLSQVYAVASPRIEEQKRKEKENLCQEIFPEGKKMEDVQVGQLPVTIVYDQAGVKLGQIVQNRVTGYGGEIFLLVGVDTEGKIRKVKVLQHNETPGLGARVAQGSFLKQFDQLTLEQLYLKTERPEGKIDAISGATISSRAIAEGVRKALNLLAPTEKSGSSEKDL
ncbi:MAG: FMN-binding protein [Candidatus Omnitrophica bacterium]|nr:FMN-binding protein [Candidatus Omnitrophota bacterium]